MAPGSSREEQQAGHWPLRLSELAGNPVLPNFWAFGCAVCRDEASLLNPASRRDELEREEIRVIGIAIQDPVKKARALAERFGKRTYLTLDFEAGDHSLISAMPGASSATSTSEP